MKPSITLHELLARTDHFLVFTSFSHGDHTNHLALTVDEVRDAVEASFDDEDGVSQGDIDDFINEVEALLRNNEDAHREFANSTWFTVTKKTSHAVSINEPVTTYLKQVLSQGEGIGSLVAGLVLKHSDGKEENAIEALLTLSVGNQDNIVATSDIEHVRSDHMAEVNEILDAVVDENSTEASKIFLKCDSEKAMIAISEKAYLMTGSLGL